MAKLLRQTAYLSLGANVGDRVGNLIQAIRLLRTGDLGTLIAVSSFYETSPVGVADEQPWFVNCAIAMETALAPEELLVGTKAVEVALGRDRSEINPPAPRTIDIDILMVGSLVIRTPQLIVPHPRMERRRFVLEPLAEIAPSARHPVSERTIRELLELLPLEAEDVRRIGAFSASEKIKDR